MDAVASENAAFTMLHEASEGKDISNRYNSLSLPEQRQALTSMRDMQSEMPTQFGNVELYDSDRDGILDDAKVHVKDKSNQVLDKDVYNPFGTKAKSDTETAKTDVPTRNSSVQNANAEVPALNLPNQTDINRDPVLRQADNLLRQASRGGDIYRQYSRLDPESAGEMLSAMKLVQTAKSDVYGNVELVDSDKNGVLDDVRVHRTSNAGTVNLDAFKTPADLQAARVERDTVDGAARAGQIILDETLRGIGRNDRGPSTGDRIQRRMGQEAVRNSNRVLRDILSGGR